MSRGRLSGFEGSPVGAAVDAPCSLPTGPVPQAPNNPPHCWLTKPWFTAAPAPSMVVAAVAVTPAYGKVDLPSKLMLGMITTAPFVGSHASAEENIILR